MFKLLKELAKAPEPLAPPPSRSHGGSAGGSGYASVGEDANLTYQPRSRSGTMSGGSRPRVSNSAGPSRSASRAASRRPSLKEEKEDEVDMDEGAIRVVQLLASLRVAGGNDAGSIMRHVETFSQLLSLPGTAAARRAFRRHGGFKLVPDSFATALRHQPQKEGQAEEESQVLGVQRIEGIRLAFETIAWALGDKASEAYFQRMGGYSSLLPKLYLLSEQDPGDRTLLCPDSQVLGHLLAHIMSNDYSCLSILDSTSSSSEGTIKSTLRFGSALPLLLAYVLGAPVCFGRTTSCKDAKEAVIQQEKFMAGHLDTVSPDHQQLIATVVRALTQIASTSTTNLFTIVRHLPLLPSWLITRIYGPAPDRHFAVTFPPREGWSKADDDEPSEKLEWRGPPADLRSAYLSLLRQLLEGGVTRETTWRLFALVRKDQRPKQLGTSTHCSPASSGRSSPANGAKRKRAPTLLKLRMPSNDAAHTERLDAEVLDLLQHAMKARWPPAFLFGGAGDHGAIELKDTGRSWPKGERGLHLSAWVYISRLNAPITLFHFSQAASTHPFLLVKILENSQISIATTQHSAQTSSTPPDDIICSAPDALIPHGQWVHFALNLRHPKGGEYGEARLYVNGGRVGAMRMPYPVPIPPQPVAYAPQMGVKPGIVPETIRVSLGAVFGGATTDKNDAAGKVEDNEWSLGRVLVLEEAMAEDLVLLSHHLGPRYTGNFQEPLGKFLTYEAATSINVYLHALGRSSKDRRLFSQPATATLVRAIRTGPTIVEESILLSVSAKDVYDDSSCVNGAFPHPSRAKQLRAGTLRLVGQVTPYVGTMLDETVAAVGGGTVVLKIIDLCQTPEELRAGLGMLRDLIKDNWAASEEMERIHGFELLSAILRPKMPQLVDVPCAKIILSILGIDSDQPSNATVRNSSAYRALALDFELWSTASVGVISVYLQHFASLLTISKHSRYNALRTFQKAAMVKRLLYALRSGFYDASTTSMLVDTLSIALTARWSGEDAIKPTFSYLVSSLCQTNPLMGLSSMTEPPTPQLAGSLILAALAELLKDEQRLVKLNRAIALHRLLVIFISSNSAYYVVIPCLQILHLCLSTPGLESFTRSFEGEGGYALLARTLGPIWREDIQKLVWQIMVDEESDKSALSCSAMVPSVTAAIEYLLSTALESEESKSPASGLGRSRSGTITSIRSITLSALTTTDLSASDNRLEDLLQASTKLYNESSAFRRAVSTKRVESMLPALAEFAAMSATSTKSGVREKRAAAVAWISALVAKAKSRLPNAVVDQASHFLPRKELKLVKEQLEMLAPSPVSATPGSVTPITPLSPGRGSISGAPGYFGSSVSSRLASSPGAFGGSATPRRRPSTDSMMTPIEPLKRRPSTDAGLARVKSGSSRVRIPLQRTLTGESVLEGGKDKNAAWKLIIIQTDLQAHSKMTLERKEHWKKVCQHDWPRQAAQLRGELGIWPDNDKPVLWRLDGSEGPLRMRNRLERVNDLPDMRHGRGAAKLRDAIPTADELSSAVSRLNVNPWEDPFSLALGEASITEEGKSSRVLLTDKRKADYTEPAPTLGDAMDNEQNIETPASQDQLDDESYVELEDDKDDKMRRIARTLQAGDVVEEAHNIVRIVGVDACPGLLILGRKNLYLIDGLVQTPEGEVIDARDSPRDALSIPSGTLVELDTADQQNARWSYSEIVESNKRAFLFREVALELYFADKRNFLVVFRNQRERQTVVQKLASKDEQKDAISRSVIGNYVLDQVARATDSATERLMAMSRKWQNREISNFAYLQLLNQHANRTPNDVTQYPVFPWVLTDFTSPVLDLSKDSVFRDLTLPMGALTPARREAAIERYSATEGVGEKPFHYGTHYSSSMIVCGFMIRMSPFTEIFLALQGGNFDLADRLFSSIPRAWDSASSENRGDVRELIPEFFYSAGFLRNINHHDFGITQGSNEQVDDVTLPSWALCDPLLFIHRHREALESDYVSRHLHTWIDLVFGYKQRDPASFNTYHPLSYRGAVDLDKIKDESEKASSTAIIHNFGQTPVQIFKTPHCHRLLSRHSELPMHVKFGVAEQWQLLTRSILPIAESYGRIDVIQPAYMEEARPTTQQKHRLAVPGNQMLSVQYGFTDSSLRVYYQEVTSRLVHVIEGVPTEHAVFANPTLLVTVSPLSIVTAWRLSVKHLGSKKGEVSLQREATLRGHTSEVTCIATSTAWSFVVTGCKDGTAAIWDTNRLRYVRTLVTPRKEAIKLCAVHECDGTIALASAHYLYVYSLNGYAIASAHVNEGDPFAGLPRFSFGTPHGDEDEMALLNAQPEFTGGISFLNREFLKYGALFVIGIDSELALFRCVPGSRAYEDQEEGEVQPWMLIEQGRVEGSEDHAGGTCTAVKFIGETLYAGFEPDEGQKHLLYQWSLPEGNARHVQDSVAHSCMDERCVKHFGLLEPRRFCGGCGGAFCGTHALHVEMMEKRYCETCRAQLSRGSAMGLMGNRKDSAQTSSRRNSLVGGTRSRRPSASGFSSQPASRAGSRRPSFSHPASSPTAPGKTAAGVNGANHTAPAGGTRTSGRSAGFSGFAGLGF